jgi:hypothetical protein
MVDRLPVFHIGANKAGSTTLQQALFARHPEVFNLAKPFVRATRGDACRAVDAVCAMCEGEDSPPPVAAEIRDKWRRALEPAGDRLPVFSQEELIRRRYYPGHDTARLPKALVEMAGPSRVVIVTRHQIALLESLYIHKANVATYQPFDRWLRDNDEWLGTYRFSEIADGWSKVVGEENVGVFLFEELVRDPRSFADRLASFIGIEATQAGQLLSGQHKNPRKSSRTQAYVKLRSKLLPRRSLSSLLPQRIRDSWHNYLEGGAASREPLPEKWLSKLQDNYRDDNQRLAERYGLPLAQYGYPL